MDRLTKITAAPARQIQKMVNEIKNNDGGIMQMFRKKITNNKAPPSVPRRDYARDPPSPEDEGTDNWSDEFDGDYDDPDEQSDQETYVDPNEQDQSYEPPPSDHEPKFTTSYKLSDINGGYADKEQHRQLQSKSNGPTARLTRPLPKPKETMAKPPQTAHPAYSRAPNKPSPKPLSKPAVMPRQQPPVMKKPISTLQQDNDEEDYIVPDDDDNYIEPTQSPQPVRAPKVDRGNKPGNPAKPSNYTEQDTYVVPENESKPSPPVRQAMPRRNSPPKQESAEEYETCDDFVKRPDPPMKPTPSPHPRNMKPKPLTSKPRTPGFPPRDVNSNIDIPPPPPADRPERLRLQSAGMDLTSVSPTNFKLSAPKPNVISAPKPPENRYIVNPRRHASIVEQDADVIDKEWYTSSSDRKAAEEALLAFSKDGSFLVRRSTGHDPNQPFTLVVFYNRKVYNIPVRYIETARKYALGREKSGEEKFSSVAEMIENHQRTQLVLIDSHSNTKDFTKLRHAVRVP